MSEKAQNFALVVIGASAGGITALMQLVEGLPSDLPAAILIVVHILPRERSRLPEILSRSGPLLAIHPGDGEQIEPGKIYISPPNRHLIVEDGHLHLTLGPMENGHRPAADPLFRSAAENFGPRTIGVVLSGNLDDGTAGLLAIKRAGGVTIAQDPEEALYPGMPASAIENQAVELVLPVAEMSSALLQLCQERVAANIDAQQNNVDSDIPADDALIEADINQFEMEDSQTPRSILTCPDCGGILWEVQDGGLVRYRCHLGHGYSVHSLVDQQDDLLESALWTAIRALTEKALLSERMAIRAHEFGRPKVEERYRKEARMANQNAEFLRKVLSNGHGDTSQPPSGSEEALNDLEPKNRKDT